MENEKDCLAGVDWEIKQWFTNRGKMIAETPLSIFNYGTYRVEEPIIMPYDFKECNSGLGLMWNISGGRKQKIFPIFNIDEKGFLGFFHVDPKFTEIMYLGPARGFPYGCLSFPYYCPVEIDMANSRDSFLLHGLIAAPFLCGWPVSFVFQVSGLYEEDKVIQPSFFFNEEREWEVYINTRDDGSLTKEILRDS